MRNNWKIRIYRDNADAALHFAVMDINKWGGGSTIGCDNHLEVYCRQYASFIRNEIEIINPDIIAIIGQNLFDMNLHGKYLGAVRDGQRDYLPTGEQDMKGIIIYASTHHGNIKNTGGRDNRSRVWSGACGCNADS